MKKSMYLWSVYFGLVIIFMIPPISYLFRGLPDFLERDDLISKSWFTTHILSGLLVYVLTPFQFSNSFRNGNPEKHKLFGKIILINSLVCILSLYSNIVPKSLCTSCKPSQYVATSIWLICVILAYIFIRIKNIEYHRKFMISAFICASYFVTVRIVNIFFMGLFRTITTSENLALLISDVFVWLIPLLIFWIIWIRADILKYKTFDDSKNIK